MMVTKNNIGVGDLYLHLVECLKEEPNFVGDGEELKKWVVAEKARDYSPELISLLLKDKLLKNTFFISVNGTEIFKLDRFLMFIEQENVLEDGYTTFSRKVGLKISDKYINQIDDVELVFPHKDCILEGGQTKEEQERIEVFFNEVLAQDEITQLFEPKVLSECKIYDKNGEHPLEKFTRNKDVNVDRGLPSNTITDNLIIKGNNLIVLNSLKQEFGGKIKLIYIDPPYYFDKKKSADTFCYNPNFKLSTWLVFMKDRLKIAREFLKEEGVILVHINESGVHWLKVLMEEIFKKENFVETYIWKNTDNPDSLSKKSRSSVEYIICYEKNKNTSKSYKGKETENGDGPILHTGNKIKILTFPPHSIHFKIPDGHITKGKPNRVAILNDFDIINGLNEQEVKLEGEFSWSQDNLKKELARGTYALVKSKRFSVRAQAPTGKFMAPEKFITEQYLSKAIGVGSNEDATKHLKKLGIKFNGSKPESIVSFFINAITEEDDIVMDFFLGSGTTAAVAHKMYRQYIGIDQMDYIKTDAIKRLTEVIQGEKGGVSKNFSWKGGGSLVYFELKKYNQIFIEEIESANSLADILKVWEKIKEKAFIRFNIDLIDFENNLDSFKAFTFEEQKKILYDILDLNQLYVSCSDMDDETAKVSDEEKKVTKDFYNYL